MPTERRAVKRNWLGHIITFFRRTDVGYLLGITMFFGVVYSLGYLFITLLNYLSGR